MNASIWGRWVARLFHKRRPARRPQPVQRRLSFDLLEDRVTPASISWTGAGSNSFWSNAANWNLGRAPLAGDDLVFGSAAPAANRTTIDNLPGLPVFNSITISASGYTLSGTATTPKLALAGAINVNANLGTQTITLDMQLLPPAATLQQTFTVDNGSHLIMSGRFSAHSDALQAAQQTLTKAGTGTLELTNDNSAYTGAVTLANGGGVVIISHANALGTGAVVPGAPTAGITTVNVNSQLQLKNVPAPVTERLKLNGSGLVGDGALFSLAGANTWAGSITLDSDSSIGGNFNTTINITGQIADTGAGHDLTKEGQGRVILSRVGGNTYRGQTIIDNGILTIRDPLSLGAGADANSPLSGSPQSGTVVNFNSTTGEAGTLQLEFVTLGANDPNGILLNPLLPFHPTLNPYIGFQVFNDLLTLNGPGFNSTNPGSSGTGILGALHNLTGLNGWDGDVIMSSLPPTPADVWVGVATNTELTISGVMSDPNQTSALVKIHPGRLILNNANTYTGGTLVAQGALNVRDSNALGTDFVEVRPNAAVELQVDKGLDGTPQRTHNRNLGFDSDPALKSGPGQEIHVTGTSGTFSVTFNGQTTGPLAFDVPASGGAGPTASLENALNALSSIGGVGGSVTVTKLGDVYRIIFGGTLLNTNVALMTVSATGSTVATVSPIYSLRIPNELQIPGLGIGNTGALRSISGINTYAGNITLGSIFDTARGSVGVEPDARPGHPTADTNYFTHDHSLTVVGDMTGWLSSTAFTKVGDGHLILPAAYSYTGPSEIREGWVTVRNDKSLGTMDPSQAPTRRPYTTISDGAAVHLKPFAPAAPPNVIHAYELNGSFADTLGGPALVPNGGTLNPTNYSFGPGQGLRLSNALPNPAHYSIEMTFQVNDLNGQIDNGWIRLIDFKNRGTDLGLYTINNGLQFFNRVTGATGALTPGTDVTLMFTRDGVTKEVVTYLNGVEQFRFFDVFDDAVFNGPNNIIHFFIDDLSFSNENSGGVVDRIRIYDAPWSPAQPGLNLINNFVVSGLGIDHPFALISQKGAIENLDGNNYLPGILQLNGQGGIGVEQLAPPAPGGDPSQLNLTGYLWDFGATPGGITKVGSRRLVVQAPGTYTGNVDIQEGVLLVQNDTALGASNTSAGPGSGAITGLIHTYELNGSFADELGGPALAPQGGTLNATNYSFGPNQGLTLTGAMPNPTHYSIEMTFNLASLTSWRNLIEFKNRTADTGLYNFNTSLQFFNQVTGPAGAFSPGVNATLLFTRDGTTNEVVGYVDGVEQIRFIDTAGEATFTGPGNIIHFFIDDLVIPNEASAGVVDRIRIFDRPLTPAQLNPARGGTTVRSGAALELGNTVVQQTQGLTGGLGIWNEPLFLNGSGNALFGDSALTVLSGNSPATDPIDDPLFATDNAWRGPITLGSDTTISVRPGNRLVLAGNIDDATNLTDSGSSLTINGGGVVLLAGNNTYRGSTFINQGVLTIQSGQALGGTGTGEVQRVTLTNPVAGSTAFTLTFNGQTTGSIPYTGVPAADAAAIQAALTTLSTVGGSATVGGTVAVTAVTPEAFAVTFGGSLSGFDQPMMAAAIGGGGSIEVTETTAGAGGTVVASGASLQLAGSFTVAGEPLLVNGQGGSAPAVPTQWFQVGPAPIANGQTPLNQNTTGRVTSSVSDPRDSNIIYITTAGGGAWKTIDGGRSWRPIFDAIPEIQSVMVNAASGTFTLTFNGQTTAPIDAASPTITADIQAALNALPSIGGEGGHVTVVRSGAADVFRVTFGGTLIGTNLAPMTTSTPAVQVATVSEGRNPKFAMYAGSITLDPSNPNVVYLATGESNNTTDSFYGTGIYISRDAGQNWTLYHGTEIQTVTVTGTAGTFTLTAGGQTTAPLAFNATAAAVQTALNALPTISGGATVTLSGRPEVQRITMTATMGTFTLTFNGQTTAAIDSASGTLAMDIQNALNALTTVQAAGRVGVGTTATAGVFLVAFGGIGDQPLITASGLATIAQVTQGNRTYAVSFGGVLSEVDVPQMTAAGVGGTGATVATTAPFNPLDGKVISKITATGSIGLNQGGAMYVATGDAVPPRNEVQRIFVFSAGSFTLTFTWPNANGVPVTLTTGTIAVSASDFITAINIQNALNALPTINGAAVVDVVATRTFEVTFGRHLANTNVPQLVANPGYPNVVMSTPMEGGAADINGTTGGPGVWRLQRSLAEQQVTIHGNAGTFRLTFNGQQTVALPFNVPATGGANPVDSLQNALNALPAIAAAGGLRSVTLSGNVYTVTFNTVTPQSLMTAASTDGAGAAVSELSRGGDFGWFNLTAVVSINRATVPTTQAVPGTQGANPTATPSGSGLIPNNPGPDDDYRLEFPQVGATWSDVLIGGGGLIAALGTVGGTGDINNGVYRTTNPFSAAPVWNVGTPGTTPDARNGGFPSGQFAVPNNGPGVPPIPEVAFNGNIKVATGAGLFAATSFPDGRLRDVYRSTDNGQTWAPITTNVPLSNYLYAVGNFSNAVVAFGAVHNNVGVSALAIAGQGLDAAGTLTILMLISSDGGATWTINDLSTGPDAVGPHAGVHALAVAGGLVASTDGGLWRYEFTPTPLDAATNGRWVNLSGNLAISLVNGVAADPSRTSVVYAGTQANGITGFNASQTWTRLDGYGGGRVAVDPNNPQTIYAVQLQTATAGVVRKSTNGGGNWATILNLTTQTAPLVLDSVNTSRLLVGGTSLRESLNGGTSWISLAAPIEVTDIAIANAQGTFAVDPDFLQVTDQGSNTYTPDTIYITDGNEIWVTKNHGQTWEDRTTDLFGLGSIIDLEVDPRNRDTVYAVRNTFDGSGGKLFVSTDAGQSWTDITGDLPDLPTWKVVIDPRTSFLYAGTDEGVFQSTDGGTTWVRFGVGMPNVQVRDMELNLTTNTLLAGTYGRSVYQMFLTTDQTSVTPINGAVVALGGSSVWTGPVILAGDPSTNNVTIGAYGTQNLPNVIPVASLNFVGTISDLTAGANPTVTKIGTGDVIFSGSNIYGGQTVVDEGALIVDNLHALGRNANGTLVTDGAVLELRSNLDAEPVTLNGNGLSFDDHFTGSLRNVSGANTYTGTLTLNTDVTIGVDSGSQLTIGPVVGAFDVTKELPGTLVLGSASPGYSGATFVNQGALRLENSDALGADAPVQVLDGAQIQLQSPAGGPPVVVDADLTISGTGIFGTGALLNFGGDNTWNGDITLKTLPGFAPGTFPDGAVAFGVANVLDTLTIGGTIGEAPGEPTGLTKVGNGELVLTQSNTYSGATEVLQGVLDITHPAALGLRSGTASVQRVVTTSPEQTGTFRLSFNGQLTAPLNFDAADTTVAAALNGLSTIGGVGGFVTVVKTPIQTTTQNGPGAPGTGFLYTVTFGGSLTNTVFSLSASGNAGTGAAASTVASGGTDVRVSTGAALELTSAGGFDVTGHKLTLNGTGGGLGALRNVAGDNAWSGLVELATDASVGADASSTLTLRGGVSGASSDLTKVGAGTLIFPSGTPANAHDDTVIDAGTVRVDGVIGDVVLNGGTLAGTGQVARVTANAGGTVNPGPQSPTDSTGTLTTVSGPQPSTLNAGTTFFVDLIDGSTDPNLSDNDLLAVTGSINLNGATLGGFADPSIVVGDRFRVLQTTGGSVIGQFAGPSTTPIAGGTSATIAYISGVKFVVDYFSDHVLLTRELANVTMTLTPSVPNPVPYGQRLTITATLTPEPGAPAATGNVIFNFDGTPFLVAITGGVAVFDATATSPLAVDTYGVSATYNGAGVFNPASAGPITVEVVAANTTTSLTSSVVSPVFGQPFTLTATVTSVVPPGSQAPGTLKPGGTVEFFRDGSISLGTATLDSNGVATLDVGTPSTLIPAGVRTYHAVYQGDGIPDNYNGSTSPTISQLLNQANSTTTVVSSPVTSVFGQPVTFTATVSPIAPNNGVPTGTVTFRRGTFLLGTGTLNASGVATFTTTAGQLPANAAAYTITASYNGDANFRTSAGSTTHTVGEAGTTTTVTSSANPSVFGQPVTFSATVSPVAPGGGVPTGPVTFKKDGVVLGTAFLNASGVANFTTTLGQLPVGAGYVISAEYDGVADTNFTGSTGTMVQTQSVNQADTTTTVASSANPSVFGQPVTFTATVAPASPATGAPTGSVTFRLGATVLGTGTLAPDASGNFSVATYTTTVGQLPLGPNQTITATYNDDANYNTSSGTVSQTVNQANTTTALTSSSNPSGFDQSVTFTATINPVAPGAGTPTGTVTFWLGAIGTGTNLGTRPVVGGAATFTTAPFQLSMGSHAINAQYSGDTNFVASNSNTLNQTVLTGSATSLASSANPSVFGQPVTFTATVTRSSGTGPTPTGTVTFMLGGTPLGPPVNLNASGVATFTTTAFQLAVGANQTVTANYSGNGTYAPSTGTVSQTVNRSNTTTTLTAAPTSAVATRAVTFTARVAALAPGSGIPTGQVTFTDTRTGIVLGTVTLGSNGVATLQAFLGNPLGSHTVRANYAGDPNYVASLDTAAVTIVANGTRTSTVALASTANPSITGSPVTFVATVRDTGALPRVTPNGTVAFYDGATLLGFGTLTPIATGVARATFTTTFTISGTTAETHTIVARYSGNPTFARSNSAAFSQVVKPVPTRTSSTALTQSSSSSVFGQPVTFTADVTDTGGGGLTPTGTVTFTDVTTPGSPVVLGTATLSQLSSGTGRATFTTNALALGVRQVTATYEGDTDFAPGSPSSPVSHTVTQASSTTTVTSSANPSKFGQMVTFTARVLPAAPATGVPTGSVRFFLNGVHVTTAALNASGVATFATAGLTVGTHTIRAEYEGTAGFAASTSTTLTQTVSQSATTATLTRSTSVAGQPLTLTARVLPVAPGAGLPTGSVTFVIDGVVRGTVGLVNGVAKLTLPNGLSLGTHNIRVVYSGDANFLACNPTFSFNFVTGRGT